MGISEAFSKGTIHSQNLSYRSLMNDSKKSLWGLFEVLATVAVLGTTRDVLLRRVGNPKTHQRTPVWIQNEIQSKVS